MSINEKANVTVDIDGKQAGQQLEKLQTEAKAFRKELIELKKSGKPVDPKYYDELKKKISATEREMKQYKKQITDVTHVVKNLATVSQGELLQAKRKLINEIKKSSRATQEERTQLELKKKQLSLISGELDKLSLKTKASGNTFGNLANGFNKYMMMVSAFAATFAGVVFGFRKIIDIANEFEERVDYLSSLTGLAGEELEWLSEKAKESSVAIIENGIRFKASAKEIVDAYTIMGGARPELLKNKEDLAQVTEKALILAAAAKMETAPAIDAVAASLNQFDLKADQSTRVINALAAGSLAGSAEVNHLTESLGNVGTVADDSNMTLEQTIAVLEVLGEKQLKGAEAGTMLRSSLMKMKAAGVGYQSGIFNLRDALIEINETLATYSTQLEKDAYKQEVFGERSITVGTILLNNIDTYESLTQAVTDTNTALDQAATNTNNNATKLTQARNRYQLLAIELGTKLAPALTFSTNGFTYLMKAIMGGIRIFEEYGDEIKAITTGLLAYGVAINAEIILTKLFAAATWIAQKAILAFNWAIKINPLQLLAGILVTAASYLLIFRDNTDKAKESVDKLKQSIVWTNDNFDLFIKKIEFLKGQDAFKWVKVSLEDFKKSIKSLDLQNLESMRAFIQDKVANSIREVANATDDVSKAQAEQKKLDYQQYLAAVNSEIEKSIEIITNPPPNKIKGTYSKAWKLEGERTLAELEIWLKKMEAIKAKAAEPIIIDEEDIPEADLNYIIEKLNKTFAQRRKLIEQDYKLGVIGKTEYKDKIKALDKEELDFSKSTLKEKLDFAIAVAQQMASVMQGIADMSNQNDENELNRFKDTQDKKRSILQKQLDDGIISQESYNAQKDAIDMKIQKKERELANKKAKRDKEMSLFNATISVAEAVTKMLTAGPIIGQVLAGIAAAMGLIQIGVIANTKVPQ
ncbi:MAG: phage tail tape measure protein, partial [Bacteroidales bacterium]|nr:phage tail tape measure protein [Bacteroidales bacterium]